MGKHVRKFFAEFIAAFMLIFIGCGTAMTTGASLEEGYGAGYICVALGFGLAILAIAYSVGNISGGHANPAVSLGVLINGGISIPEFIYYVIAQVLGAIAGSSVLILIYDTFAADDMTYSYANCLPMEDVFEPFPFIFIIEAIATFIFVMTVLGATSKRQSHGSAAGFAIAGSLTALHLVTIKMTGAAINPARALGPAAACVIFGVGDATNNLPAYILGPLCGGLLAGLIYRVLEGWKHDDADKKDVKTEEKTEEKTEDKKEEKEESSEKAAEEDKKESVLTSSLFDSEFPEAKEETAAVEETSVSAPAETAAETAAESTAAESTAAAGEGEVKPIAPDVPVFDSPALQAAANDLYAAEHKDGI